MGARALGWPLLLWGSLACAEAEQGAPSTAPEAREPSSPTKVHLGVTKEKHSITDPTPVAWAAASAALRFSVGIIEEEPENRAHCLPLPGGHVLAAHFREDIGGGRWAWYLELEPTASGGWAPCAMLYSYFNCLDLGWYGEGDLMGGVTVDSRWPNALRCRLELRGDQYGEEVDMSVSFRADPKEYSQDLEAYLAWGLDKSLGLLK